MDCAYRHRLSAFHDGQLAEADAHDIELHVRTCAACAAELAELSEVSAAFAAFAADEVPLSLFRRARAAADDAADRATRLADEETAHVAAVALRVAGGLTALAASVLLASWIWPGRPTGPTAVAPPPMALAPALAPEWERVAMTLDAGPLEEQGPGPSGAPGRIALAAAFDSGADARLADWMVRKLGR